MKRISYFLIDTRYDQLLESIEMTAPLASAIDYKRSAIRYGGLDAVKFTTLEQSDTTLILEAPDISRRMVVIITNLDEPAPIYESREIDYDAIFEAERKQHETEVKRESEKAERERQKILERAAIKKKESAEYLNRQQNREAEKIERERKKAERELEKEKAKPGRPRSTGGFERSVQSDKTSTRDLIKQSTNGAVQSLNVELATLSRTLQRLETCVDGSLSTVGLKRIQSAARQSTNQLAKINATIFEAVEFCDMRNEKLKAPSSTAAEIRKNDERARKLAKNTAIIADDFSDLL